MARPHDKFTFIDFINLHSLYGSSIRVTVIKWVPCYSYSAFLLKSFIKSGSKQVVDANNNVPSLQSNYIIGIFIPF